jgi:hypothetical protein
VVAIGPFVLVAIIIWIFWRAARRADAAEATEREAGSGQSGGG